MESREMDAKEILEIILQNIVKYPDDVQVERSTDDGGVLLRCWVNKQDMGWIVGTNGEHAIAIRTVIKMIGLNRKSYISVKVEEPESAPRR